ncbi:helicase-exonuclease AddAB subunit AddA [Lacticaseibacillus chiayiensis]|uniref:helicase-exonuclease AddAB subunit AddA n=1 Tax=Lacticaseibacillus chiayiensis TaxID=2100821 RepID=UPI0010127F39|nr:helicase-exonuclease AddAB subunit AddA [Lacticaseibacillus chiayiensis]RXT58424.1 helicase-exonuclease AddAB subunit AddA [Lacticaseibacillus chiayiensis]
MTHFTSSQQAAIDHHGHDVLVSASAGSGKTTVLVERIIQKILKQHADITRMLIVTFTRAATAEMRTKIQSALKQTLTQKRHELNAEDRRHLANQIALVNAAKISTLDAFSLQIVQTYYYVIDLDPGFRLLTDETERYMLQERVWNDLREQFYAGDDAAAFEQLTANFSGDRDDSGFQDLMFELMRQAAATTDPEAYLHQLAEPYAPEAWEQTFNTQIWPRMKQKLLQMTTDLTQAAALADQLPNPIWHRQIDADLAPLQHLLENTAPTYDTVRDVLADHQFETWSNARKGLDDNDKATKKAAKQLRDAAKTMWQKQVAPEFALTSEQIKDLLQTVQPMMEMLTKVARQFLAALTAEKADRHVQDYSDIAHNALRILQQQDPQTGAPIAENYRASFDEVMVDEYQDISPLQEALLAAVSTTDPGDRFMVGDVKQSIYGFRLADPQLFIHKYQSFADQPSDPTAPERIILAENFRSTKNVLAFTNLIFSQIMDPEVGDLSYDDRAALKYGAVDYGECHPAVKMLLYSKATSDEDDDEIDAPDLPESEDDDEPLDVATGQTQMVIAKIQRLVENPEAKLWDRKKQGYRRIHYRDITLLTRQTTQNSLIQTQFAAAGVPLFVADTKNFFKTTELMVMLAMLKIIDNPKQDIPLVAVLRSPIVGLSADQLALIRLAGKQVPYYDAVTAFLDTTPSTSLAKQTHATLTQFFQQLKHFRDLARENDLVTLLWAIYQETGFLDYVGGTPGGSQRQANLQALIDRAQTYESGGFKGLFAFIHFITLMQKQDQDLATPAQVDPDQDAVRLMTIHKSKGLEFPVVFVMQTNKHFNRRDQRGAAILTKNGIGVKWLDPETRVEYELPQYQAAKAARQNQMLAEEMRLLYVALTRAQQRLYVVGATMSGQQLTSADKTVARWAKEAEGEELVLAPQVRSAATNYLDWIGPALIRHPQVEGLAETTVKPALIGDPTEFAIEIEVNPQIKPAITTTKSAPSETPSLDLSSWFKQQYPYQAATTTAGFQSVSEIKRAFDDPDTMELVSADRFLGPQPPLGDLTAPVFLTKSAGGVSATAVGTATHLLLQLVDLTHPVTHTSLDELRGHLITTGAISKEVAAHIDLSTLVRFFATDLGRLMQGKPQQVHREVPFSMLLPADRLFKGMKDDPGEDVLIHGIIDGYVSDTDGVTLFDYKTDHEPNPEVLVARYRGQLNLYAQALTRLQAKPVNHRYLVLLRTGTIVDLVANPIGK